MKTKKRRTIVIGVAALLTVISVMSAMFIAKKVEEYEVRKKNSEIYVSYKWDVFWEKKWPLIEELFFENQEEFNYFASQVISDEDATVAIWYDYEAQMYYGRDRRGSLQKTVMQVIEEDERLQEFLHFFFQTKLLNRIEIYMDPEDDEKFIRFVVDGYSAGIYIEYNPFRYERAYRRNDPEILAENWLVIIGYNI